MLRGEKNTERFLMFNKEIIKRDCAYIAKIRTKKDNAILECGKNLVNPLAHSCPTLLGNVQTQKP